MVTRWHCLKIEDRATLEPWKFLLTELIFVEGIMMFPGFAKKKPHEMIFPALVVASVEDALSHSYNEKLT